MTACRIPCDLAAKLGHLPYRFRPFATKRFEEKDVWIYVRWGEQYNPITVAARSKVWVCGRWLAGIAGSNPAGGVDVCLL